MYIFLTISILLPLFFLNMGQSSFGGGPPHAASHTHKEKMRASAEDFSGAVDWAHKKGITGKGIKALIIESHLPTKNFSEKIKAPIIGKIWDGVGLHAEHVATSLLNIAPDSEITFLGVSTKLYDLSEADTHPLREARVINLSLGTFLNYDGVTALEWIKKDLGFFQSILRQNKDVLFVKSAGNDSVPGGLYFLNYSTDVRMSSGIQKLYTLAWYMVKDSYLGKNTILVGSINRDFSFSDFSSLPGSDPLIHENFLFALGEDLTINESKSIGGTSFSAPTVSGAALLLKQAFPNLSMIDIKEALLESASKSFFCYDETGDDRELMFVYEDGEYPDASLVKFMSMNNLRFRELVFNPWAYGKGILDLRAAFIYAELKNKSKKQKRPLSKEQLRSQMKRILKRKDNSSATKIQALVRRHQVRKRKILERLREERKERPKKFLKPRIGPKPAVPPKPEGLKKPSVKDLIKRFKKS
jgi:hypothetical protein